jgi:thiamine-phosphate pyrophosphorylase
MSDRDSRELLSAGSGLYLVLTGPVIPHVELALAACQRGVGIIQLREKDLDDEDLVRLARELSDLTRNYDTLFIVNDRPDIAAACGADGVHVGQGDVGIGVARAALRPDAIVGVSVRTPEEAEAARSAGADYVGVGPVFPTDTKADALEPIWLPGLREVSERVPGLPIAAIGGITSDRAPGVIAAGASYVAVISAVCHARDPVSAIDDFVKATRDR